VNYGKISTKKRSGIGQSGGRQESHCRQDRQRVFLGDCSLTADELLLRLEQQDPGFEQFLFSKIIENSRQPSRYLPMLFASQTLQTLLDCYLRMAGDKKKVRLGATNLTVSLFTITDGHFFKLFDVFRESQFSKSGFA